MVHGGRGGPDGQHRRRPPSGVTVAAGVVVLLAVAALVLRPTEDLLHSGNGPLGRLGIVAIGLTLAWAVGLTLVTKRLRARVDPDPATASPREERLRAAAVPILLAGPVALGVLALVLHHFTRSGTDASPVPVPSVTRLPDLDPGRPPDGSSDSGSHRTLYIVLGVLLAALVVWAVVFLVRRVRRLGLTPPPADALAPQGEDADDRQLLLSAVESGRRALPDGADARAAVIACYAAMEEALAASGVDRRASDSPADLLARATRAGLAAGPAAPRLTALFREARYSSHPMDDSRRAAAAAALEEIAAQLHEREAAQ
ncbi:DUF4129 domain-containing protein [Streptomyces sp. NPDC050095]|uniref:DUF4129 domain-containing protein n=1 Tax=unclassified Streptomyces TaxID=2593676 RepID=UPI0034188342